jgi:hypothetical protein
MAARLHDKIGQRHCKMGAEINSWFHYKDVRQISTAWGNRPSGLGYYDIALYSILGQKLEGKARQKSSEATARILDLGTYFGHSAFCFGYGASKIRKDPILDVLGIDIFEQPQWLLMNEPGVVKFVKDYGSTSPESIGRWLDTASARIGLERNPVRLMKRDVLTLSVRNIAEIAPEGFELIAVDCAKSPELMNRVSEYVTDPGICRTGTIVAFQDLFDWHAPWNVFALSRMLDAGIFSLNSAGPRTTPYAEKIRQRKIEPICDVMTASPLGEEWCRSFTTLDKEMAALEQFIRLFRSRGYKDFVCRLECLKVGALLRAGRIETAQALLTALDHSWPMEVKDSYLQNAFCRLMHLKTGKKDLSLVFDTRGHQSRNSSLARNLRRISSRLGYLLPIRSTRTSQDIFGATFSPRHDASATS